MTERPRNNQTNQCNTIQSEICWVLAELLDLTSKFVGFFAAIQFSAFS